MNEQTSNSHDVLTIGVPPMFGLHDQDGNGLEIVEAA